MQKTWNSQNNFNKGTTLEDFHFPVSKLTVNLQLRRCGTGVRGDSKANRTELRAQK